MWGIIDQLEMTDEELGATSVRVVEQKTRFQPSMPGHCQKRTTAVQTMIYRQAAAMIGLGNEARCISGGRRKRRFLLCGASERMAVRP